jgi:phosphoserine aminotransferase
MISFSSGPCRKFEHSFEYTLSGRSHRSEDLQLFIKKTIKLLKSVLEIPDSYSVAFVPGSSTGAMESIIWNILGTKMVNSHTWDIFGEEWAADIKKLGIPNIHHNYRKDLDLINVPDLVYMDNNEDHIFCVNGTSSGICIPEDSWPEGRSGSGLWVADLASTAFCYNIPWKLLDASGFSFQKGAGGEAGVGVVVLSPKALERLNNNKNNTTWAIPKVLRLSDGVFNGLVINTPSMYAIEEFKSILEMIESKIGLKELINTVDKNYSILNSFISHSKKWKFLINKWRSKISVCIVPKYEKVILYSELVEKEIEEEEKLKEKLQEESSEETRKISWEIIKSICDQLKEKGILDVKGHGGDKPCLRIWIGPTITSESIKVLAKALEDIS